MRHAGWILLWCLAPLAAMGQWTNRYPKLEGYSHHVYVEGFELPIFARGPTDPAPSPDGEQLAFAASGWLWLLDLESGEARRITDGPSVDSRPAWSVDGSMLAFLRDDSQDIDIWALRLATGEERPLVETSAIELDPAFSQDGEFLYYSSAIEGDLDVWRLQLATSESMRITSSRGLEVRPLPLPDGHVLYLSKERGGADALVELSGTGPEAAARTLAAQSIVSQTHPAVSPDGASVAVNWPSSNGYELRLVDRKNADVIRLRGGAGLPLSPAFSPDGRQVYFTEANARHDFELHRISIYGGSSETIPIRRWDWGVETALVTVRSRLDGRLAPVRLSLARADGHPMARSQSIPRFDGSHGRVYSYSDGSAVFDLPAGEYRVRASHGFVAVPQELSFTVSPPASSELTIELERVADPRGEGWLSGDHHYHMNYGGPYRLVPRDLEIGVIAEDLDYATPLMANLHHRLNDLEHFSWATSREPPWIEFGQEIRSHFLGHLGLVHVSQPFWPWFWGPGYPIYGADDRPNLDALRHAREHGGIATYMHPISIDDPFADETAMRSIPVSFIPDAVLGDLDAIELACLWTSEAGTSELWYRLLNIGAPLAANAGTDVMVDYYRTMAVGATRVYVDMRGEETSPERYLDRLKEGRSFITTGPILDVSVDGSGPGESVGSGQRRILIDIRSVVSVERIEVVVNGAVSWSSPGGAAPFTAKHSPVIDLPEGGWVAVRALSESEDGPGMNRKVFAHTSPIWIGERGSRDPSVATQAASDLLEALSVAETRLLQGYAVGAEIPRLAERFTLARERLEAIRDESQSASTPGQEPGGRLR